MDLIHYFKLQDILKFGVHELFENEDSTIEDVDFEAMLGKSRNGEWQPEISTDDEKVILLSLDILI